MLCTRAVWQKVQRPFMKRLGHDYVHLNGKYDLLLQKCDKKQHLHHLKVQNPLRRLRLVGRSLGLSLLDLSCCVLATPAEPETECVMFDCSRLVGDSRSSSRVMGSYYELVACCSSSHALMCFKFLRKVAVPVRTSDFSR